MPSLNKNNPFILNFQQTCSLIPKYKAPACKLLCVDGEICAKELAGSQLILNNFCHEENQMIKQMDPKIFFSLLLVLLVN